MTRPLVAPLILLITLTSLAASQVHSDIIRTDDNVMAGRLMKRVPPVYPPLARQARIQGTVILKVRIGYFRRRCEHSTGQRTSHARARRD